jgi:hypothetical protein
MKKQNKKLRLIKRPVLLLSTQQNKNQLNNQISTYGGTRPTTSAFIGD